MAFKKAGADLGAFGVEQDAHGNAQLARDALHALHAHVVLLMAAVGEIEAGDVHAREDHLAQRLFVITSRAHGAYDLGSFAHTISFVRVRTSFLGYGILY